MKPLVYIAGPYAKPDPVLNTREACLVADRVVDLGAAVIVPHLSLLWHAISPQPVDTWYARDLDVLRHCHALVRIPGESTGADDEVDEACRLGLQIFSWPIAERQLGMFIGRWRQ